MVVVFAHLDLRKRLKSSDTRHESRICWVRKVGGRRQAIVDGTWDMQVRRQLQQYVYTRYTEYHVYNQ